MPSNFWGMQHLWGVENPADPHMAVRLYQFQDNAVAAEWFEETAYDRFAAEGYAQDIELIDLSFDHGNATSGATYAAEFGGTALVGTVVWVQVNDVVARISVEGADGIDLDVLEELAGAQVNCMLGTPCDAIENPYEVA